MPKAPGSGALWTKIKSIKDFKEKYIKEIIDHVEDALAIKDKQLYGESENLQAGAANFYLSEYSKLEKEFRNTEPQDLVGGKSAYEKEKERKAKEEKAGIRPLLKKTYEPEDEFTGTDY